MKRNDIFLLVICIIAAQLAGLLGSFFNFTSLDTWFIALEKPLLNPPSWVFGPVWTFLFLLMGISLFLFIREGKKLIAGAKRDYQLGLFAFGIQWLLNVAWSFFFFYLRAPQAAFIEIVILIASIIMTIYFFYRLKPAAAWLLLPYLAWVLFATYLNFAFWQLNLSA